MNKFLLPKKRKVKRKIPLNKKKRVESNSPIEEKFHKLALTLNFPVIRQYNVGKFFIDFAYLDTNGFGFKIAIELDGQRFHSSYSQRQKDYERERYLLMNGWTIIRFTGSEINRNCNKCINEVIDLIDMYNRKLRVY